MKYGMTKKHTQMLYGIAIAMMLYHHLFCIPSRLNCNYFSVLGNIELKLAWFCRICVAVYAFITGYGLCKSSPTKMETNLFKKITQDYKFILKHLFQFMKKYWIVFVFFVPIRMIVNPPLITPKSFIMSLFGLDYTYNGEWWYIKKYIVLLILFPILNACFILLKDKKLKIIRNSVVIGITLIVVIEVLFYRVNIIHKFIMLLWLQIVMDTYICIFIIGYICAKFQLFELGINNKIYQKIRIIWAGIILIICIAIRVYLADKPEYTAIDQFITAPFVYALCIIMEKIPELFYTFGRLGKYSVYMWLTHTFYCYYCFQGFITFSGVSTIIYLELMIVSLLTAILFTYIENKINEKQWLKKES